MPPYEVKEMIWREELDAILDIMWAASKDNYDPSHKFFFPIFGDGIADRNIAIQRSKDRLWQEHRYDPSSNWIYIQDQASETILGGCQWRIYTKNPFRSKIPAVEAVWWPEGDARDFATDVVQQFLSSRVIWMARPHVGLSLLCVHPEFWRQGFGSLLMDWGHKKADDLHLESFVEATESVMPLLTKYGYRGVAQVKIKVDEEWDDDKELRKLLPLSYTGMWRPSLGVWKQGDPEDTWKPRLKASEEVAEINEQIRSQVLSQPCAFGKPSLAEIHRGRYIGGKKN